MFLAAAAEQRLRVIVSSDIGGTDPDDFQSMVQFLLYADVFDVEGILSSPYGNGSREAILKVIGHYEHDYPNLRTYSARYPTPDTLRSLARQGSLESAGLSGFLKPSDGSRWLIECARRNDPRPLHLLVWGGIDDLAQALHDAPDILPKLRVYFIGGPNKMWSVNAYDYIERNHPTLHIIEANTTYRGWFTGGNQQGEWGNQAFVAQHVAGHGALGEFFVKLLPGVKMGDSPSIGHLLHGSPEDPSAPGWGGKFVRIWHGRMTGFNRLTTAADEVEAFGVVEFAIPLPEGFGEAKVKFDNRISAVAAAEGGVLRFRFSPRDAKVWPYVIEGAQRLEGQFTAVLPALTKARRIDATHPNWWIDDPDPAAAEGVHMGAKHVSRWREEFLRDFAARMMRCKQPAQGSK